MCDAKFESGEGCFASTDLNPLTRFLANARNHPLPQGERMSLRGSGSANQFVGSGT
jgi:hypothetical protein